MHSPLTLDMAANVGFDMEGGKRGVVTVHTYVPRYSPAVDDEHGNLGLPNRCRLPRFLRRRRYEHGEIFTEKFHN